MLDPSLEVRFRHRLGTLELDVDFHTVEPWCVLFGPSGSGKSTILRAIAGLTRPDEGRIAIGGEVVFDSTAKVWVPAHQRPMRWGAQRAMLDPAKTVKWNWPIGMKARDHESMGRGRIGAMDRVATHFDLQAISELKPGALSGGQRQIVGVVRAAAGVKGMRLLLDEPFSGLDAAVREQLIENLRSWVGESAILSVTHDVAEAFLLDAEVVRIANGRVVAQGPVAQVLAEERRRVLGILG